MIDEPNVFIDVDQIPLKYDPIVKLLMFLLPCLEGGAGNIAFCLYIKKSNCLYLWQFSSFKVRTVDLYVSRFDIVLYV